LFNIPFFFATLKIDLQNFAISLSDASLEKDESRNSVDIDNI